MVVSLALIPPSGLDVTENNLGNPTLEDIITKCRRYFFWEKTTEPLELLDHLDQTVKNSKGQHVRRETFEHSETFNTAGKLV